MEQRRCLICLFLCRSVRCGKRIQRDMGPDTGLRVSVKRTLCHNGRHDKRSLGDMMDCILDHQEQNSLPDTFPDDTPVLDNKQAHSDDYLYIFHPDMSNHLNKLDYKEQCHNVRDDIYNH